MTHSSETPAISPATVWATNGGLFFGYDVAAPANAKRPLEGKDAEGSLPRQAQVKSTWKLAGGENTYTADRHVLTVGPNGSGKTRKLLMPNLYRLRDYSCVVIDPKGELAAHTAVFRAARPGHKVVVLDPFGVIATNYPRLFEAHRDILRSHGFNPLAALDPDPRNETFVDDAKALAVALIKTGDSQEKYWSFAAQALLKGIIMALRIRDEYADLSMLRAVLGEKPKVLAAQLDKWAVAYRDKWPAVTATLGEFADPAPEDKELGGIRRQAKVQTDWLDSKPMTDDLAGGAFDFTSIKRTPTTIYLVLPPEHLASHGTWLRLMITAILRPLLRSVEAAPVPVLFMLDEFAQLGHMEIIKDNYALMRGYGIKLWTIWQDLNQAKILYGDWWESFIANAGIVHSFAPQDLTTRDYLSRLSGEDVIWHDTGSSSANFSFPGGVSLGGSGSQVHIVERVMKPHELAALQEDESVMFYRRGQYRLGVTPQPEYLTKPFVGADQSVSEALRAARSMIEGHFS